MNRNRLLLAACIVVVLLVAGATSASALWRTQVTATTTVTAASLEDSCTDVTAVKNASFEEPIIANMTGSPSISQTPDNLVPGWISTPERIIEIWNQNNYLGIAPQVGNQFVELNASEAGTLSQSIDTVAGQVVQWSLLHRGRAGVDTMQVLIGPAGGAASTQVSQGNISDGMGAWVRYSGTYVVPAGQASTQLSFKAVSTGGNGDKSIGNFMDDVSFGSGPCLEVSSVASKFPAGADTVIRAGDTVEYATTIKNIGSSPSFRTVLTNLIPAGLSYTASSVKIGATLAAARASTSLSDASDTDVGKVVDKAITVSLGTTATPTVGGSIAQGSQVVLRFLVVAPSTTTNGTSFDYTPTVTYVNNLAPQWTKTTISPNAPISVMNGADLALTASAPATVNVGSAANYVFTVLNSGPQAATGVAVRLTFSRAFETAKIPNVTNQYNCVIESGTTQLCTFVAAATFPLNQARSISFTRTPADGTAAGLESVVTGTVLSTSTDPVASNNSAAVTTTTKDDEVPTQPGQLVVTAATATQISLTGSTGSTDNVSVVSYNLYRGTVLIANVPATATNYTDTGLLPSTTYTYTARALDAAGNLGAASPVLTRSTATSAAVGTYKIVGANGLCAAYTGTNGTTQGSALVQNTCATVAGQRWKIATSTGETLYNSMIPSNSTTLSWETVDNGFQANPRYRTVLNTYTGADTEDWRAIQDDDALTYHFVSKSALTRCLTAPSNTVGAQLTATTCTGAANQSFTVTAN